MREEPQVDSLGKERRKRREATAQGKQNLEQCVQGVEGIIEPILALEALSVESNVPICRVVNQLEKLGYNRVQAVSYDRSQRSKFIVICQGSSY